MQINSVQINKEVIRHLKKSDQVTLALKDVTGKVSYFGATITKVISDIPICKSCGIRLDNKEVFKFGNGNYCKDCHKRRIERQREIGQRSADLRKKIRWE